MKAQKNTNKPMIDLKVHVRDGKGNIVQTNPYRLFIVNGIREYERPPGSGWIYEESGKLIRKPSAKQQAAQEAKEFSQDALLAQIEELKAQLAGQAEEVAAVQEEAELEVPPVEEVDNSEEIRLMEEAGAIQAASELKAVSKPLFNKPSFLK